VDRGLKGGLKKERGCVEDQPQHGANDPLIALINKRDC